MNEKNPRQNQAKVIRIFRKIHRTIGAFLFIFFFVVSVTGLLLGWKKQSGGYLLAKSQSGSSTDFSKWLPIDSLHKIACKSIKVAVSPDYSAEVSRVDIRKDKGMVKFIFKDNYWGIQLDGATGRVLQIEKRRSDFIENLHDGSFFDSYFDTSKEQIKLIYTSIMGLALLTFTLTGFWLWYGPIRMRKNNK